MGSEHYCLRWNNHQSNLLGVFSQLLQDESLVDVTLACAEGHSIRAHKVVLSACSSYFQTLFIDHPNRHPIVILKDVCFAELRTLVEFMYKGEVSVEYCQLSALLKTAESLKVKGLAEMTHLSANTTTIKREREDTPNTAEMENKRLMTEDTKVLSPRQSPMQEPSTATATTTSTTSILTAATATTVTSLPPNSTVDERRRESDEEAEDEHEREDVRMEDDEQQEPQQERRGAQSPLRGGCPGPADLSASGLALCQPTPTCSSRTSSPHSSEAFPGPSCLPPVQQVPLSLKKEVDWDRDDKSTAGESSSDYNRQAHDAVGSHSEDDQDEKYVTSCGRDKHGNIPFPMPFAPFSGLLDGPEQINRTASCSLLSFLTQQQQRFAPVTTHEDALPCPTPGPPTPFRCSLCLAAFPSAWLLEQHNTLQHASAARNLETGSPGEDKPFRCEQCGQSYRYRSAYLKHQEQNHRARLPADKLFTCDVCGMQFRYLKSFKKHRLNHALERLHSRSPDLLFRAKSNGTPERRSRSPRNTPESSTDLNLKALNLSGGINGRGTLRESGRVTAPPFTSADSSSDQVTSSNEALGELSYADRAASAPAGRTDNHFFKFDDYYCFRNMGDTKSGKSDSEQDETVDSLAYALSVANNSDAFRYQQEASLMNLLRMESNDRQREHRFSCPFCGKCVRSKENLKLHIRKHTGERPFVCLFCGRAFGGKSDLTRHLRIHTGERPYHCEMCGKCFARADYLSKHLTTHIHSHNARPPPTFLSGALMASTSLQPPSTPQSPSTRPLQQ